MPTLFVENCYKTLDECQKILGDRAGQYDKHADSWREFPFSSIKMAMRLLGFPELPQDKLRLIASAALVDLKISRMVGDYKQDTFVDLINYALNLDAEMQRVKDEEQAEDIV